MELLLALQKQFLMANVSPLIRNYSGTSTQAYELSAWQTSCSIGLDLSPLLYRLQRHGRTDMV